MLKAKKKKKNKSRTFIYSCTLTGLSFQKLWVTSVLIGCNPFTLQVFKKRKLLATYSRFRATSRRSVTHWDSWIHSGPSSGDCLGSIIQPGQRQRQLSYEQQQQWSRSSYLWVSSCSTAGEWRRLWSWELWKKQETCHLCVFNSVYELCGLVG